MRPICRLPFSTSHCRCRRSSDFYHMAPALEEEGPDKTLKRLPILPNSRARAVWAGALLCALIYEAFSWPFKLVFIRDTLDPTVCILDVLCDVLLLADVLLRFFLAFSVDGRNYLLLATCYLLLATCYLLLAKGGHNNSVQVAGTVAERLRDVTPPEWLGAAGS